MTYAQVVVNITVRRLDRPFTYLVPEGWEVARGCRVLVPFGPRMVEGFVVAVLSANDLIAAAGEELDEETLKPIREVLDETPWFDESMLETARQLADYYLCSLSDTLRLFVPGKNTIKTKRGYQENLADLPELKQVLQELSLTQRSLYEAICSSNLKTEAELMKLPFYSKKDLQFLLRAKVITTKIITSRTANEKTDKVLAICAALSDQGKTVNWSRRPAQKKVIDFVQQGCVMWSDLKNQGVQWDAVKRLQEEGWITFKEVRTFRRSYGETAIMGTPPVYTKEQQDALAKIIPSLAVKVQQTFLLHGVTGSGKTEVYLAAAAEARRLGQQVIMLVPEIALTGQIVRRFKERFGEDVVVIHSKLSFGERFDSFCQMKEREAGIVIGARSALFVPAPSLGLIMLDEEHEFTYKQEELPRYHARTAAIIRAKTTGATVLLGSATPALETYYEVKEGRYELLSLDYRVDKQPMPQVELVDLAQELKSGRRTVISPPLANLLTETMQRGEQAIILINRRGYSTFILCRECGHVISCPHCAIAMVYHSVGQDLRCHYCRQTASVPDICPACGSRYIKFFGTGTQKVEEELHKLLPDKTVVRMDQDTTSKKFSHDRILKEFLQGKQDILLGTQMVAKGHDIHNVTAVGVISADTALNLPDFRAAERTFALITQAAGRAGRGDKPGTVVVQTYNPDHYALLAAADHDYRAFYDQEIEFRRQLSYPPFCQIIKIIWQGKAESPLRLQAEAACRVLQNRLTSPQTEIIGPVAAAIAKIQDTYRLIGLIKTSEPDKVRDVIRDVKLLEERNVTVDVDPLSLMY
ncbi:MAG: primosomal protein N' [Sporomusaceae bacterium]|nr:primosomal protein N' [Sporomusaceae bacterium]